MKKEKKVFKVKTYRKLLFLMDKKSSTDLHLSDSTVIIGCQTILLDVPPSHSLTRTFSFIFINSSWFSTLFIESA
jgi:hypothetical protein